MSQVNCLVWTIIFGLLLLVSSLATVHSESESEDEYDEEVMQQKIAESVKMHGLDPGTAQIMVPPKVSDEERGSRHLPKYLRCAGCLAIAHQFDLAYQKAKKSVKTNGRLSLADQIDVAETVCDKKMDGYGLKESQGKKVLSGPGLASENLPGVMEAGGKWEARLKTMCLEVIEEFEEEGIYELYTDLGQEEWSSGLCGSYCNGKDEIKSLKHSPSSKTEL